MLEESVLRRGKLQSGVKKRYDLWMRRRELKVLIEEIER